jgi:hypothetical protein
VFFDRPLHAYLPGEDTEGFLRLIPSDIFGPPEKCYYRQVSEHPALLLHRHGEGAAAAFPWQVGSMYGQQCHVGHAALVMSAIDGLLQADRRLVVRAPPLVEVTHRRGEGFEWVALFNHSGQLGTALHAPLPIENVRIELRPHGAVRSTRLLRAGEVLTLGREAAERMSITVARLADYEIVLLKYE